MIVREDHKNRNLILYSSYNLILHTIRLLSLYAIIVLQQGVAIIPQGVGRASQEAGRITWSRNGKVSCNDVWLFYSCIYTCVIMYICMLCILLYCVCMCMCTCAYIRMCACMSLYAFLCVYVCVCMRTSMHVHIWENKTPKLPVHTYMIFI